MRSIPPGLPIWRLLLVGGMLAGQQVTSTAEDDRPQAARSALASDAAPAGVIESASQEFADGWEITARTAEVFAGRGKWVQSTIKIAVEQGWLQATRQTAQGEREWQIVLAEVAPGDEPPEIKVDTTRDNFRLSYRGGKYFIREYYGRLRSVRQRKDSKPWPNLTLSEPDVNSRVITPPLEIDPDFIPACWWEKRVSKSWVVIATGPKPGRPDCILRLARARLRKGYDTGLLNFDPGTIYAVNDDRNVIDDGELMVAVRLTEGDALREAGEREGRAKLAGTPAPRLASDKWLNHEGPLTWPDLKGHIVLLDFWHSTESDSIDVMHLARMRELHASYADRGLTIVGLFRDWAGPEPGLAKFLGRERITFPVMIDHGGNAERYFVDRHPMYFLVDRDGNVAWSGSRPPPNEEIEQLIGEEIKADD